MSDDSSQLFGCRHSSSQSIITEAPNPVFEHEIILVVIGPQRVGKTTFLNAMTDTKYVVNHGLEGAPVATNQSGCFVVQNVRYKLFDTTGINSPIPGEFHSVVSSIPRAQGVLMINGSNPRAVSISDELLVYIQYCNVVSIPYFILGRARVKIAGEYPELLIPDLNPLESILDEKRDEYICQKLQQHDIKSQFEKIKGWIHTKCGTLFDSFLILDPLQMGRGAAFLHNQLKTQEKETRSLKDEMRAKQDAFSRLKDQYESEISMKEQYETMTTAAEARERELHEKVWEASSKSEKAYQELIVTKQQLNNARDALDNLRQKTGLDSAEKDSKLAQKVIEIKELKDENKKLKDFKTDYKNLIEKSIASVRSNWLSYAATLGIGDDKVFDQRSLSEENLFTARRYGSELYVVGWLPLVGLSAISSYNQLASDLERFVRELGRKLLVANDKFKDGDKDDRKQ